MVRPESNQISRKGCVYSIDVGLSASYYSLRTQAVLDDAERSNFWLSVWQQYKKRKEFPDFKSFQFVEDNNDDSDGQHDLHVSEGRQNVVCDGS